MRREHPRLWHDLPAWGKQAVVARVDAQLPKVVRNITQEIGQHIDQLLDPKIMVIEHFRQHPGLVVSIFREVGRRELRLMVTFGFVFGFLLGVPVAVIDHWFGIWWLLPLMGIVVGWITNKLGMWLIFEPLQPRRILGIKVHGLFLRRQDEAAEVYARNIADEVITLERIGDFLMNGPRGDRTRQMLGPRPPARDRRRGRPAAPGDPRWRWAPASSTGSATRSRSRRSVAPTSRSATPSSAASRATGSGRSSPSAPRSYQPEDFVEMMRSAFREDEWMLYAHGAVMGFAGGVLHLLLFGAGGS